MFEDKYSAKEKRREYKTAINPVIREAIQNGNACSKFFFSLSFFIRSKFRLTADLILLKNALI